MRSDQALRGIDAAVVCRGHGTEREILVNGDMSRGILLESGMTNLRISTLISDFECAMYGAIKKLLKKRRAELIIDRGNRADEEQPFFFTGHWTSGANLKHGERHFVFSIANTKVLRLAAGLSGGGPRSPDYRSFPNERFLEMPWNEKQALIDRAIGADWQSLQAAIKPSAADFGVVAPDLRGMLNASRSPAAFFKRLFEQAKSENVTGEVRRGQPQYMLWCFIAYLRRQGILLLPLRSYYVQFWSSERTRYDNEVIFSEEQNEALQRLWDASEKYEGQNRLRMMRIAQTVFLCGKINILGDVSPEAFMTVIEGFMGGGDVSPSYRDKLLDLTRSTYDFFAAFWNADGEDRKVIAHAGTAFRHKNSRVKAVTSSSRRKADPFWFAEVPNDQWHKGHPLPDYSPKNSVIAWAAILRETFPHFKVKDPNRFRAAGVHWLSYINSLADPPMRIEAIVRGRHINDLVSQAENTFRRWLVDVSASPGTRNDILASVAHMFDIHMRIHNIEARNPIEFDLDRFLAPQPRGKTPRTPLSPEMLKFIKDFNRRDDFAFSRGLKPLSSTAIKAIHLRHYRRVIDPDDGDQKIIWWPGLPVLLDLMLTIPLRGFQARWLDTGEGDEFVTNPLTLEEHPNALPTAQKGRQMGVFRSFVKGGHTGERLLGLRITTNKRGVECDGRYGIPWCSDDLRDSLAMLMAWQRRYNPVTSAVRAERDSWVTELRSEEVTALIPQVFPLFRDPATEGGAFPPTYQQVQTYWNLLCAAAEDELHSSRETSFRLTRDRVRGGDSANTGLQERVALFDLHTLRVSGITALIEAGLPPHFVQEIVGHAAIVMTLYYHKVHPGQVNSALSDAFERWELSLDRIPELLDELGTYESFLLNNRAAEDAVGRDMLRSAIGNGSHQILSHGICPGGDCRTGGEYLHAMNEHDAVPRAGACSLCRYRITGPMFLAGLVVNANKIMAELHSKGQEIARLNDQIRERRRDGKSVAAFEARYELLHRELEDLWLEWAAEHRYVEDSAGLLTAYLKQQGQSGRNLPVLAADGAIAQMSVKAEHQHPFHLSQMLAEASAFVPSDRHVAAIGMRDAFLNELLANNRLAPFLLRLDADMRLHAGNMLGRLLSEIVPDADLQAVHDGTVPVTAFTGLQDAIRNLEAAQCVATTSLGALWPRPTSALLEIEQ